MTDEVTDLTADEANSAPDGDNSVDTNTDDTLDSADTGVSDEGGDEGAGEADTPEGEPDDDTEEVEHQGAKYKVPKAIRPLLLMQQDYSRKTAEVAETRRALETRQAEIEQRAEIQKANIADYAKLHGMASDLETYRKLSAEDWAAIAVKDKEDGTSNFDDHRRAFKLLEQQHEDLAKSLQAKEEEASSAAKREAEEALANQRREMAAVITGAKKGDGPDLTIPGVNADLLNKIGKFGTETYGITSDELGSITDPRILKALHDAYLGRQLLAREKQAAKVEKASQTAPAKTVGGAAPNARKTTDPSGDKLSTEEWIKREREREAAKRAASRRK